MPGASWTYIEKDEERGYGRAAVMVKKQLLYGLSVYDWSFYRDTGGECRT